MAQLWFEGEDGRPGEVGTARFSTAGVHPGETSFVWTGDTAGQGWGINPDLGGMTAYRTMLDTRPDFFLHAGTRSTPTARSPSASSSPTARCGATS